MRHHNANRKFGMKRKGRKALGRSLVRALVVHGKMKTTLIKAKEIRPAVEKLITRGKIGTVANRRLLTSKTGSAELAGKIIKTAEKYKDRKGGYTRITKLGRRISDGAQMAIIEFV
ncbi:MAG: 50S ribosomal protein L17 [Candidatus Paceibacterota bacterium]|jgi:large subunit ribosomal protein L17